MKQTGSKTMKQTGSKTMNSSNPMSAIILTGGQSHRMGVEKALLKINGIPLIQQVAQNVAPYCHEIIISAHSIENFSGLPYRVVIDREPFQGPLMGILSGLEASHSNINFIVACDIPELDISLLQEMRTWAENYEIVVPMTQDHKLEPLLAFYHRNLIPRIEALLKKGIRKIIELYPLAQVKYIPFTPNGWYYNLNTEKDYLEYLANTVR